MVMRCTTYNVRWLHLHVHTKRDAYHKVKWITHSHEIPRLVRRHSLGVLDMK
jgi:hypothetical protein